MVCSVAEGRRSHEPPAAGAFHDRSTKGLHYHIFYFDEILSRGGGIARPLRSTVFEILPRAFWSGHAAGLSLETSSSRSNHHNAYYRHNFVITMNQTTCLSH